MTEQHIRYVKTSDGVSIACTTIGDGPPVLVCLSHAISMQYVFSVPDASFSRRLATRTRLTTFDPAGIGASQRDVRDFSLDAQVRAIEAVASRLADDQYTLIGAGTGNVSAALFAARHPGRVRDLVCVHPGLPMAARIAAAMRDDWSAARRHWAGVQYPDGPVSSQRWFSNAMRESMTSEVGAGYWEEFARTNLMEIYRRIAVPTLICVPAAGQVREASLALASLVPDCRVAVGGGAVAILEFMGVDASPIDHSHHGEPSSLAVSVEKHGTAIILFADIADSTALTERLGDTAFREKARALDDAMATAVRQNGGTVVTANSLGDGILATFSAASQAIAAALSFEEAGQSVQLGLHVGLHAGDVMREANNVFGGAVNIAARISALAAPGEVLVSRTVADLARTSAGVTFEDRGEHALKGIAEPQRVFAVRSSGAG